MPRPRLHLDADTSIKALLSALVERGHDVTRTPNDWITPDAGDEAQLLAATAQGRCIFTFNVRDSVVLARGHPRHGGIILAAQASWTLSELVMALDRLRDGSRGVDWSGALAERLARMSRFVSPLTTATGAGHSGMVSARTDLVSV